MSVRPVLFLVEGVAALLAKSADKLKIRDVAEEISAVAQEEAGDRGSCCSHIH